MVAVWQVRRDGAFRPSLVMASTGRPKAQHTGGAVSQEQFTGSREVDLAGGSDQELGARLLFELTDLLGQRWLGHVQALGGTANVLLLGHRTEVSHLTHFHVAHLFRRCTPMCSSDKLGRRDY